MKTSFSGSFAEAKHLFVGIHQRKPVTPLSAYQERLFSVALNGFGAFTFQELKKMTAQDRKTIMRCFGVTQKIMNDLEQWKITNTISVLFDRLFPNAQGSGLSFLMMPTTDPTLTTRAKMRIPKDVLIKRMMEEDVLPANFLTLNKAA